MTTTHTVTATTTATSENNTKLDSVSTHNKTRVQRLAAQVSTSENGAFIPTVQDILHQQANQSENNLNLIDAFFSINKVLGNLTGHTRHQRKQKAMKAREEFKQGERFFGEKRWGMALRSYNVALQEQRDLLGNDNLWAGRTLNRIGLTLMHLDESFGALTALKEALYIFRVLLGPDHAKVQATQDCIQRLLREESKRAGWLDKVESKTTLTSATFGLANAMRDLEVESSRQLIVDSLRDF